MLLLHVIEHCSAIPLDVVQEIRAWEQQRLGDGWVRYLWYAGMPRNARRVENYPQVAASALSCLRGEVLASEPNLTPPTGAKDGGAAETASAMMWQEAAEKMERLRSQGEAFTSQHKLAAQLGCSSGTINKAIRETPELQAWAKRQTEGTPRAQSLNEVVTHRTPQSRELDPADDAAIREFIEQADPQTKAWFLALPPETQLEVAKDPDKHHQILGRKP
jgi:hypothetical protein